MKEIIKSILWPFFIKGRIKRMIKNTTSEREYFKSTLQWDDTTEADKVYLNKMIETKNEILYILRHLIN